MDNTILIFITVILLSALALLVFVWKSKRKRKCIENQLSIETALRAGSKQFAMMKSLGKPKKRTIAKTKNAKLVESIFIAKIVSTTHIVSPQLASMNLKCPAHGTYYEIYADKAVIVYVHHKRKTSKALARRRK